MEEIWDGNASVLTGDGRGALVDCKPWHSWSKWPRAVAAVSGRYLQTFSGVKPDHVARFPLVMALISVDVVGLKSAA